MNLRKFISGVSAIAIAASAFAGMAVTANAASGVTPDAYGHNKYVWDFTESEAAQSSVARDRTLYYSAKTKNYVLTVEGDITKGAVGNDAGAGYGVNHAADLIAKIGLRNGYEINTTNGVKIRVASNETSSGIEFYAPVAGEVTITTNHGDNKDYIISVNDGTATENKSVVVDQGDKVFVSSKTNTRWIKTITLTQTNYGIDESDTASYEGTSWTATSNSGDTGSTGTTVHYAIAIDSSRTRVVSASLLSGQLVADVKNGTFTLGAKESTAGIALVRNGDTMNYIAPAAGVITVTFGPNSNGVVTAIDQANNGTSLGAKTINTNGTGTETFTAYLAQGQRLKIQASTNNSNAIHLTGLTLDTSTSRKSIASAGAVTAVQENNADAIYSGDESGVAKAFTCTVSTGINGQFNTGDIKVKVSGKADQSPTSDTVITNGSVLIGIIATASEVSKLPDASAFEVTVE